MDLNDIPHVEGLGDASERHDIVMQLASEATDGMDTAIPNHSMLCDMATASALRCQRQFLLSNVRYA